MNLTCTTNGVLVCIDYYQKRKSALDLRGVVQSSQGVPRQPSPIGLATLPTLTMCAVLLPSRRAAIASGIGDLYHVNPA